tara:strand:+ start:4690 stop:5889 length:1200 start_codon:yes stop_codon:yes gene_type:complete
MALLSRTGSVYGSMLPIGRAAGGGSWENDGTTWSNLMTVATGSFDIAKTKGFSPPWETAQEGECARTSDNAPMVTIDFSSNPQTITESIYIQCCSMYHSWAEITVDGVVYTDSSTGTEEVHPDVGTHTFNISGELTKIRLQNPNSGGRTYLEGIKIDGQWMVDGHTGTYTEPNYSVDFNGTADELEIDVTGSGMDWGATESFTWECWVYLDTMNGTNPSYQTVAGRWATGNYCWLTDIEPDGSWQWYYGAGGSTMQPMAATSAGVISTDTWYHLAVVKNGTTANMYVNGTSEKSWTYNLAMSNNSQEMTIGNSPDVDSFFNGHISNMRFTVGQALYTSNFTPPTEPLTTTSQGATASNVKLLCCQGSFAWKATKNIFGKITNYPSFSGGCEVKSDNPFS